MLSRIDALNQQVASQNDQLIASWAAKTVPREPKTPSRRLKSPPRPSKEGPRAPKSRPRPPQDGPRTSPGALLGRSWSHLGTIRSQDRKPVAPDQWSLGSWRPSWGRYQKSRGRYQKSRGRYQKSRGSWDGLGAILGPCDRKIEIQTVEAKSP